MPAEDVRHPENPSRPRRGIASPVAIRRGEGAQRKRCRLRLTSIESVMPSSHLILCHPLLLLPPIPPQWRRKWQPTPVFLPRESPWTDFFGCLMSSAGIQKLFCGIYLAFKCSFDEFVGEKVVSIESVMPPNHLILCHPFLLLPSTPPSITVFSNESTLRMRWPKY